MLSIERALPLLGSAHRALDREGLEIALMLRAHAD
jgi:hypothetical protein